MIERIKELLAQLVGFPTVSSVSNLPLIDWAQTHLEGAGFTVTRIMAPCGQKAGLLARFGQGAGGVLLSAHTDVVPVEGQSWSRPPFALTESDGLLYGRGTTDMKGFIACVLALAEQLRAAPPARPLMIALSWDEEVGCRGIGHMIDHIIPVLGKPDLCIVGEPTGMRIATGHKGKASYHAVCSGRSGHSALAPQFDNALHKACDLVQALRREQDRLFVAGAQDPSYLPPVSTVHAGILTGGSALNIVPDHAEVHFEIRHLAAETPHAILDNICAGLPAGIEITETGRYPGLAADLEDRAFARVKEVLADPAPIRVAFGTEAGFFAALGIATIVLGPGSMSNGHQPDEHIACADLVDCAAFLRRLVWG